MTESEQMEYLGLAATVGRLMTSLKQTEARLADATAELTKLTKDADSE